MNVGRIERACLLLLLGGCEHIVAEAPPPPSRHEVPAVPPGARGARAAGTDSAPKPFVESSPEPGRYPEADEEDQEPTPDPGPRRPGKDVPL